MELCPKCNLMTAETNHNSGKLVCYNRYCLEEARARLQIKIVRKESASRGMKIAYIAGPYRGKSEHEIVNNIRAAELVAQKYWQKGYAVICPHKNTALFGGLCPDETWLAGDIEIMKRCDVVVMMENYKQSSGAKEELAVAQSLEMEIIFEGER